ncbi:hypothetical protein Q4S45_08330 [Massilia sp. R2A-15]|uniref:hypothetical protein n=1 Tax=Massilia sp. R2A-15 TaxID=3064278 RepID=UPI0027344084|nr:hypothetical protein [Massilia sp. R2A-15]WLI91112.1 hypothetical protein Q4S45_08330 [Massilia sp. R2A-15]
MKEIAKPDNSTAPDETVNAMRSLRRARQFMWVSTVLVAVSLFAVIACTRLEWSRIVPYLMWNHVAIIAVFAFGMFAVRGLSGRPLHRSMPRPGELFARPILIVAVVAALVAAPNWVDTPWDMGPAPDGSIATSHNWHASPDGSHYFESFNRGADREISQEQYDQLNRGLYSMFARIWVLFSFLALMTWRFVALSRDAPPKSNSAPSAPAVPAVTNDSSRSKSTALIAAIWTLAIGANLANFALGGQQEFCSTPMPPEMQLIVMAMPIVFFCVTSIFMKRALFVSPWIASLIDRKRGAGFSASFMVRLKPLLLFSATSLICAAGTAMQCAKGGEGPVDWTVPGFLLSCSVAFALTHVMMRWRRVPGV